MFPGQVKIVAAEMAVCGGAGVHGAQQVKFPNDRSRPQVKYLCDCFLNVGVGQAVVGGAQG